MSPAETLSTSCRCPLASVLGDKEAEDGQVVAMVQAGGTEAAEAARAQGAAQGAVVVQQQVQGLEAPTPITCDSTDSTAAGSLKAARGAKVPWRVDQEAAWGQPGPAAGCGDRLWP